jgi:alpha-tubulin suppressor-like RCC1 family protein
VTLDGTLLSWGDNKKGKLGLGSGAKAKENVFDPSPSSEAWDPLERVWVRCHFRRVWVGKHHCAATDKSGGFYTWGDNAKGQLGLGDRYPAAAGAGSNPAQHPRPSHQASEPAACPLISPKPDGP